MEGYLTASQIEYVLYHLGHTCSLEGKVREWMEFRRGIKREEEDRSNKIVFQMSDRKLEAASLPEVEGIPVLFPIGSEEHFFSLTDNRLIFHHDLIKSCFYLLSGYQELHPVTLDSLGRFSYDDSIQKIGNFIHRPLVNEYFEIMIRGIKAFAATHHLKLETHSLFENWAFFLSHDVDSLDTYTWHEAGYRLKQLAGLAGTSLSRRRQFRVTSKYIGQRLNFFNRENAHWDFDYLHQLEHENEFRSTYFFLPKDQLHHDAYYQFDEPRVLKLFHELALQGSEIGIHGTVRSAGSYEALKRDIDLLQKYSPQEVRGIRQHRLHFDRSVTHALHEKAGLWYDTTLGFAQHEGFRNSYCLPFKPFDHQNQRIMDYWEIPLAVMDVTLFEYRKLSYIEAVQAVERLLNEVIRFNGVFSLLWHNGQCNEFLMPGMRKFLSDLLKIIAGYEPESLLGYEIVLRFEHLEEVI